MSLRRLEEMPSLPGRQAGRSGGEVVSRKSVEGAVPGDSVAI
jgi:hypothetical protein